MSGNPLPWLILFALVVGVLAFKGYIRLPSTKPRPASFPPASVVQAPASVPMPAAPGLEDHPAWILGLAFAKAAKREAEHGLASTIANQHLDDMIARFQSPFSPPAPPAAGPSPAPAGPAVNPR